MRHFTNMPDYRHINTVIAGSRYRINKPHIFMKDSVWHVNLKYNTKGMVNGVLSKTLLRHYTKAKMHVIKLNRAVYEI